MDTNTQANWREEYERRTNDNNYPKDKWNEINPWTDTLLCEAQYPESQYELDFEKVADFIETQISLAEKRWEERMKQTLEKAMFLSFLQWYNNYTARDPKYEFDNWYAWYISTL